MWRYAELLPPRPENIVSLGEGSTPLIRSKRLGNSLGLDSLMLKLEYSSPTGSFKDRGSSAMISMASQLGVNTVFLDSSGNAASSVSAYSAKLGTNCFVFVPEYTSEGKVIQSLAYGSKVLKIKGNRKDAYNAAEYVRRKFGWYYCGFQTNPYSIEGSKTIAFEVLEQLDWAVPDWVVFPVGTGSAMLGFFKGMQELKALGIVDQQAALACVQPEGCCPISNGLKRNSSEIIPVNQPKTVAEGLMIGLPINGLRVIDAVRATEGVGEIVSDPEILRAGAELASLEGIFVEPSAAASSAGVKKLVNGGIIERGDTVVCILTGSGLKTQESYRPSVKDIPSIYPREEELEATVLGLLEMGK